MFLITDTECTTRRDGLELTVVRRVIPDDVKRAIGFEPLPDGRDLKGKERMAMREIRS